MDSEKSKKYVKHLKQVEARISELEQQIKIELNGYRKRDYQDTLKINKEMLKILVNEKA